MAIALGGDCEGDGECASGLCAANLCLDPNGDDDLDGVINSIEASLGSDPLSRDSDGDGQVDGNEIATDSAGIDTDGDGKLDIVESRTRDADGDCITDQFDAEDDVANTDLSPMRTAVCKTAGICGEQLDALGVACPRGLAVCIYDDVVGHAEPEAACDGVDENCDGRVDGGFPANCEYFDWDADGVKDAVDVCPEAADPAQVDSDGDGIGNACRDAYEVAFEPAPPTALTVGETFSVAGVVRKKGERQRRTDAHLQGARRSVDRAGRRREWGHRARGQRLLVLESGHHSRGHPALPTAAASASPRAPTSW